MSTSSTRSLQVNGNPVHLKGRLHHMVGKCGYGKKQLNGKCRMCTYYTDLNRACPKDAYLLPNFDHLVDVVDKTQNVKFP